LEFNIRKLVLVKQMISIDQPTFDENLRVTKAYCEFQLRNFPDKSPAEVLRSINPIYKGYPLFSLKKGVGLVQAEWHIDPLEIENPTAYDDFFEIQLKYKNFFLMIWRHISYRMAKY